MGRAVDAFIQTHRIKILAMALLIALIGIVIATQLRFDLTP